MADIEEESEDLIELGDEGKGDQIKISKEEVTPRDVFRLGKGILLTASLLFLVMAFARILFSDNKNEAVKEVWNFSSVALNSIIALVLGYYFGKK